MSILDTMAPFISAPWLDLHGHPLPARPLPGLRPDVLQHLKFSYPGTLNSEYREFLGACSGIAGTAIGHIDFTGCWYPEERCPVFSSSLTLAVDDQARRWITELSDEGLPGRVWCLFTEPEVAVHVSESLPEFLALLRGQSCRGRILPWLQSLTAQAHAIWAHRRELGLRPYQALEFESHTELAGWLTTLPGDAYVYDLRSTTAARGWPYGLGGPTGRLFRYQRQPVFAVAGPYSDGSRIGASDPIPLPGGGSRVNEGRVPLPARPSKLRPVWRELEPGELRLCA